MKKRVTLLLFITLLFIGVKAQGQSPGLITDRPDMTESASVAPLYSLQIEAGSMLEYQKNVITTDENYTIAGVLLRFGISKKTEIRPGSSYSSIDRGFPFLLMPKLQFDASGGYYLYDEPSITLGGHIREWP